MRGIFLVGAWLLACASAVPAVAGDRSIDPMSWNDGQWRGTLMESRHAHVPPRYRTVRVLQVSRVEQRIVIRDETADAAALPAPAPRARLIRLGDSQAQGVRVTRPVPADARCTGVLVLTWTGTAATPRCHTGAARVRTPSSGY